jgi:hypothetical protein
MIPVSERVANVDSPSVEFVVEHTETDCCHIHFSDGIVMTVETADLLPSSETGTQMQTDLTVFGAEC